MALGVCLSVCQKNWSIWPFSSFGPVLSSGFSWLLQQPCMQIHSQHHPVISSKETVNFSQQTGFIWTGCDSWVCGTYPTDFLMSLQHVSIFPLFRNTCQQVPREISSSTGSLLLSSWAAVIGSDQAELYAFAWERNLYCIVSVLFQSWFN